MARSRLALKDGIEYAHARDVGGIPAVGEFRNDAAATKVTGRVPHARRTRATPESDGFPLRAAELRGIIRKGPSGLPVRPYRRNVHSASADVVPQISLDRHRDRISGRVYALVLLGAEAPAHAPSLKVEAQRVIGVVVETSGLCRPVPDAPLDIPVRLERDGRVVGAENPERINSE